MRLQIPHLRQLSRNQNQMGEPESVLKVLMLPWLAHGHISPFLELAKKLTKRNIFIYLCSTPINLISVTRKLTAPYSESIKLVEIRLPNLPNLPPHYHTTNGLPPHLMATLKEAFQTAKPELLNILVSLKPDFVVHDNVVMWAGDVAWSAGIPAIDLLTFGATFISYFMNLVYHPGQDFPFPRIYLHEYEKSMIVSQLNAHKTDDFDRVDPSRSCNLRLIKSSREVEGKYIDYLTKISNKEIIPIGILVDQEPLGDDDDDDSLGLIQWLGKKEKGSCIFVSFGSEYFLTNEETKEIAHGLEMSNVNFIWVVRISKEKEGTNVKKVLPNGFLNRVGERGRIVEGWAPQGAILRHSSIGGFMSHCGWSSILESMTFGVPIIAMPMQIDQPINARLVIEIGVGLEIAREEKSGKVTRESVSKTVREVVVEAGGDGVRRRVKEIGEELMLNGEEEIDELVKRLIRINQERKQMFRSL